MTVEPLRERVFSVVDRTLPLDRPPVCEFPQWGQWLETPDLIAARLAPGQLEVNLVAPFTFISTRFAPGHGLAAFDSDQLHPYRSQPGGFDVVPQGSSYRSIETTGVCILLAYKQPIADRILAEYTDGAAIELHPGQLQASTQGTKLAQALQVFFADDQRIGGSLYLESLATLIMGQAIRQRSSASGRLKRVPDYLLSQQLQAIVAYIDAHLQGELRLHQLAAQARLSPYYFAHAFKAMTGWSPHQYVLHRRLARAQHLLRTTQMPIAAIAYEVGFGSQSHMTTVFRRLLQTTPSRYRQQTAL
jgi:AraC-like DNA-binding protein